MKGRDWNRKDWKALKRKKGREGPMGDSVICQTIRSKGKSSEDAQKSMKGRQHIRSGQQRHFQLVIARRSDSRGEDPRHQRKKKNSKGGAARSLTLSGERKEDERLTEEGLGEIGSERGGRYRGEKKNTQGDRRHMRRELFAAELEKKYKKTKRTRSAERGRIRSVCRPNSAKGSAV